MNLFKQISEVRKQIAQWRAQGLTIGLVPTMGYLHDGHASLIEAAARENDRVVVSIFVNPIQFGPTEDLDKYPRDLERDKAVCSENGASVIFHPEAGEMYPEGFCSHIDMTDGPTENLCGASRPGHFRGVCTVVAKLFHIVQPDNAYFGQKDAQQLAVIRRMILDFNIPVKIHACPIVREADGLALSSRNRYLNEAERKAALCLSKSLDAGKSLINGGETNPDKVMEAVKKLIEAEPLARIDYVSIVDPDTIRPLSLINGTVMCAVAVHIGNTRLIDNFIIRS